MTDLLPHDDFLTAPSHRYNYGDYDQYTLPQHLNVSYLDDDELNIGNAVEMVPVELAGRAKLRTIAGHHDDELDRDRPSNERLLLTAFFSFMGFTIAQSIASYFAGSEAMMGDSAAMGVDALTYLFNLLAERRKSRFEEFWTGTDETDPEKKKRTKQRAKRKMILQLEIFTPILSVTTLLVVTGVVLHSSIGTLVLDSHRDQTEQGDPNVNLMLGFSLFNIVLDVMNVCCFARANRFCGYNTSNVETHPHGKEFSGDAVNSKSLPPRNYAAVGLGEAFDGREVPNSDSNGRDPRIPGEQANSNGHYSPGGQTDSWQQPNHNDHSRIEDEGEDEANLNMCSAYTHVFADTLRSVAVVIAASLAELVDGVTSEEADAAAAVTVSILIILSLLPLARGLCRSGAELRGIYAEERDEKLYNSGVSKVENKTNEIT